MFKFIKKNHYNELKLYNKILTLSRNKLLYTKFGLDDTFQNRIYLIFIHISFLFIKIKKQKKLISNKKFYQNLFDLMFQKIEIDMRENGHGDMSVNKNMKLLVKSFYNVLFICENFNYKNNAYKQAFLRKNLTFAQKNLNADNIELIEYFDNYYAFCFDLSIDNVLNGDLNFTYK